MHSRRLDLVVSFRKSVANRFIVCENTLRTCLMIVRIFMIIGGAVLSVGECKMICRRGEEHEDLKLPTFGGATIITGYVGHLSGSMDNSMMIMMIIIIYRRIQKNASFVGSRDRPTGYKKQDRERPCRCSVHAETGQRGRQGATTTTGYRLTACQGRTWCVGPR
jgi:hypothetical protein